MAILQVVFFIANAEFVLAVCDGHYRSAVEVEGKLRGIAEAERAAAAAWVAAQKPGT